MSDLQRPEAHETIASLDRPADYWGKRAERARARGDYRAAAVFLRRAIAIAPTDGGLRAAYARLLSVMACYSSSNREAFCALALEPRELSSLTLIARNMRALGREQEALDAYSNYLSGVRRLPNEAWIWEDELYEVEDEMARDEAPRRASRTDALMQIAFRLMREGKTPDALERLRRVKKRARTDARLSTLCALLYSDCGQPGRALSHARRAVALDRGNVRALCMLAGVQASLGRRAAAGAALLSAASRCRYPHDEQLFCSTADEIGFPELVFTMLRRMLRQSPLRLSSLCNMTVYLLKQGALYPAQSVLGRCQDVDPDDLSTRCLARLIGRLLEQSATDELTGKAARELHYYPMLSSTDTVEQLMTVMRFLKQGLQPLCDALQQDRGVYEAFLYALRAMDTGLDRVLTVIAPMLPPLFAQCFLRDALTRDGLREETANRLVMALVSVGAKPPYDLLLNGRFVQIERRFIAASPEAALDRALVTRLKAFGRGPDGDELVRHALGLLRHMDQRRRYAIATGDLVVWRLALRAHARACHPGAKREPLPPASAATRRRARAVFLTLCRLQPPPPRPVEIVSPTNSKGRA